MSINDLAEELRRQATQFEGDQGDHVRGMRMGLLLAAVQVQHVANAAAPAYDDDMPSPWMRRNIQKIAS